MLATGGVRPARANGEEAEADGGFPPRLTLDEAIRMLRTRGLDVLIAEAQVRGAEGDVHAAGAVPNPVLGLGYGRVFNYVPGPGQDDNQYTANLSDQAALTDSLWGKRGLRLKVARAALAAAQLGRDDAVRLLEFQVKQQYAQMAQAIQVATFSREVAATASEMLELNRRRYPKVIDAGALARIETQKLEADQALDQADQAVIVARVALAFLLGARGDVGDFDVDPHALDYRVLASLATVDAKASPSIDAKASPSIDAKASPSIDAKASRELLRLAFEHRPDLQKAGYDRARALASIDLARRQPLPDLTLSLQYTQTGTGSDADPAARRSVSAFPRRSRSSTPMQRRDPDAPRPTTTTQSLARRRATRWSCQRRVAAAYAGFATAQQPRGADGDEAGCSRARRRRATSRELQFEKARRGIAHRFSRRAADVHRDERRVHAGPHELLDRRVPARTGGRHGAALMKNDSATRWIARPGAASRSR